MLVVQDRDCARRIGHREALAVLQVVLRIKSGVFVPLEFARTLREVDGLALEDLARARAGRPIRIRRAAAFV